MMYNESIYFIIVYHYEANAILATPITGLKDLCIFKAYKKTFIKLSKKGFKPILNVMDNQATTHINKIHAEEDCKLQLAKLHNHHVNAAKHAIQTIKMHLLQNLQQLISLSHSNCGTGWHPKSLIALTWCVVPVPIQPNWHPKSNTDRTIGIAIHLRSWGARQSYTMMETPKGCGHHAWLGIPIFGSDFWDPHRKRNSDSVFDSKDVGRILFLKFGCLECQKIGILICDIWNSGNFFAQKLSTSYCC